MRFALCLAVLYCIGRFGVIVLVVGCVMLFGLGFGSVFVCVATGLCVVFVPPLCVSCCVCVVCRGVCCVRCV